MTDRLDRGTAWLIFAVGVLHCGMTFLLFDHYSEGAMWFFSAGLAMIYCAALNLLRVRYAGVAPGLRAACIAANLSLLAFILVYVVGKGGRSLRNPGVLLFVFCAFAATSFSLFRARPVPAGDA